MGEWLRSINEGSIPLLVAIQSGQTGGLTAFMRLMSQLGTPYFYLLFFPFLYWVISKRLGILAGLALLVSTTLGDWNKWFFKLPRPPSPPVQHLWEETSPGFVSTHASNATAIWGSLAVLVHRGWLTVLAVLLILLISFSRLYLGVHFPADVAGGWLVGLVTLFIVLRLAERVKPRVLAWSPAVQVVAAAALSALVLLLFPGDWEGVRPAGDGVRDAALLFGLLIGLVWDHHSLHFQVRGTWPRRLLRFVLGLVLVLLAYFALDILFGIIAGEAVWLQQSLRFVRYAVVGFVIPGAGPWLFQRLRLT
ncbi:MAG: phosphatase PAP2 family protein [Caldilineae bacterium]|nr:MAG: phosphatase PAP2 family protein [Caldilineae bacterium]